MLSAAVSLRKQGATKGATTAFLISTPESGVDSIALTYAMMDPLMTVARPLSAFLTAFAAGVTENLLSYGADGRRFVPDLTCPVDGCCDGVNCDPRVHRRHHGFGAKLRAGLKFALIDLWGDIAAWFFVGLLLAGLITALVPEDFFSRHLGSGLPAMLLMLAVGIPLYICASASTPIAAALILKGVSPGVALVFLLAGPATNMASITVLAGVLGKKATAVYLGAIAVCSVLLGQGLDYVYGVLGISARAVAGQAGELIPAWAQWLSAGLVSAISVKPVLAALKTAVRRKKPEIKPALPGPAAATSDQCGPANGSGEPLPACSGPT